jgi:hypothetical protein
MYIHLLIRCHLSPISHLVFPLNLPWANVWGQLIGHEWCIYSESDKSSGKYSCLKVQWKDEQKNWTVKHNLSYWMSKEPHTTTDFYKLPWTPKFTDNQRIADTDICIFMSIFAHICVCYFRRCFTLFGVYPNYVHIKMFVQTTCKYWRKQHR